MQHTHRISSSNNAKEFHLCLPQNDLKRWFNFLFYRNAHKLFFYSHNKFFVCFLWLFFIIFCRFHGNYFWWFYYLKNFHYLKNGKLFFFIVKHRSWGSFYNLNKIKLWVTHLHSKKVAEKISINISARKKMRISRKWKTESDDHCHICVYTYKWLKSRSLARVGFIC